MTNAELKAQHNYNCEIIYRAICELNLDSCVEWSKVQQSKTDDLSYYMKKIYEKKKAEKEGGNNE